MENQLIKEMLNTNADLTEKQRQILSAATEIFAEKGFAAASTNEIAKKAGVAEGTIFRHYKTKKDLLLSIVTPMMIKLMAPIIIKDLNKVLLQEFDSFEQFIRAMIENRAKFLESNLPTVRILIQEIPSHPELKEQFIEHVGSKVFSRLRQIVEHYQAKKQIMEMPPEAVLRFSASMMIGHFAAKHIIYPDERWDDAIEIERTIAFLIKGLSPE